MLNHVTSCVSSEAFLSQIMDNKAAKLLQAAWYKVQDYAHKSSFWPVYTGFVSLTFQRDFLQRTAEHESFRFLGMVCIATLMIIYARLF